MGKLIPQIGIQYSRWHNTNVGFLPSPTIPLGTHIRQVQFCSSLLTRDELNLLSKRQFQLLSFLLLSIIPFPSPPPPSSSFSIFRLRVTLSGWRRKRRGRKESRSLNLRTYSASKKRNFLCLIYFFKANIEHFLLGFSAPLAYAAGHRLGSAEDAVEYDLFYGDHWDLEAGGEQEGGNVADGQEEQKENHLIEREKKQDDCFTSLKYVDYIAI